MPADTHDRTEAPTPRRRIEAREKGQVARSADLSSAIVLLGAMIGLGVFGNHCVTVLTGLIARQLGASDTADALSTDLVTALAQSTWVAVVATAPLLGVLLVLAAVSGLAQVGFLLSGHPLRPTLNKLNPLAGLSRMFSARTAVQLVMNLLKLAIVAALSYRLIRDRLPDMLAAIDVGGRQGLALLGRLTFGFGIRLGLALLVLALLDFLWQRFRHERDLRMTREEVREELRRMEGDPLLRQRRRQLQMQFALQRIRRDVPKADVVVTNPTQIAVAIRYDPKTMNAPRVVAKGQGYLAQRIRELALAHGVPVVERKPLAQALFKAVEAGQEIPATFYRAVAEILAYVYELSRSRGGGRPAGIAG